MNRQYDFVHFFLINSPIYNKAVEDMLLTSTSETSHLFVYAHDTYCEIRENVICDPSIWNIERINDYLRIGKYVVLHSLEYSKKHVSMINKETAQKIIWCVWGHDIYSMAGSDSLRGLLWRILSKCKRAVSPKEHKRKRIIKEFRGVFVGFHEDGMYLKKKYGKNLRVYGAQYPLGYSLQDVKYSQTNSAQTEKKIVRVLIGHSAAPFLRHKRVLKRLRKYKGKVELHLPLSYGCGGKRYAEEVEQYAKEKFGKEHVCIYKSFMPKEEYIKLLGKMDVAVFDMKYQAALGNIFLLLYLGKKLYVNPRGCVGKGLLSEGVDVYGADQIGKVSIERFSDAGDATENICYAKNRLDVEYIRQRWNEAFLDILCDN